MVREIERLAIKTREYPKLSTLLGKSAKLARKLEVPEFLPDLDLEWTSQAEILAKYFAKKLGFKTQEKYIATLPQSEPQPKKWRERFDVPIIVETRPPLEIMLELAGIVVSFDVNRLRDWARGNFQTPDAPYTAWVNDGSVNLNKSVDTVRNALSTDERGGTVYDGIAVYLRNREILNHHSLDFPGSEVNDYAPNLFHWRGRKGLRPRTLKSRWISKPDPRSGSVVAGRK